jgi:predicted DNA-binding transcriptional regulator AlpA
MGEGRFPQAVRLGEKSVAWPEAAVDAWVAERLAASGYDPKTALQN